MKQFAREGTTGVRKCAFCKYYYDPTNSVIDPKSGQKGIWEYEFNVQKPCLAKSNRNTPSNGFCSKFECKL